MGRCWRCQTAHQNRRHQQQAGILHHCGYSPIHKALRNSEKREPGWWATTHSLLPIRTGILHHCGYSPIHKALRNSDKREPGWWGTTHSLLPIRTPRSRKPKSISHHSLITRPCATRVKRNIARLYLLQRLSPKTQARWLLRCHLV